MIPTSGTITRSLNRILWMNQTKTHVPKIAVAKAKRARLHKLEIGINNSASKMPSCAEENVAPVVGEINLLLHNCCMISPATLIPIPVHKIARSRGSLEIRKISICSGSPLKRSAGIISMTPTNKEQQDKRNSIVSRTTVDRCDLIKSTPFFSRLGITNQMVK